MPRNQDSRVITVDCPECNATHRVRVWGHGEETTFTTPEGCATCGKYEMPTFHALHDAIYADACIPQDLTFDDADEDRGFPARRVA